MSTEGMNVLIDMVYDDKNLREALLDIIGFKKTMIARFSREDFELLEEAGFRFSSQFITQRRAELNTFLFNHPECMSGDHETLIDKISYLVAKLYQDKVSKSSKRARRAKEIVHRNMRMSQIEIGDEDQSKPSKPKKSKKKREYSEEESSDD